MTNDDDLVKYVELPDSVVDKLYEILEHMEEGRVWMAREKLEFLLGIPNKEHA